MFRTGIVFSGSGGQGVITASIILAEAAALHGNMNAVQAQAYGPEARGGATRADVILSDEVIRYPKVLKPHVLITLTQMAFNKFHGILRPGGLLITDSFHVRTVNRVDAKAFHLPLYKEVLARLGKPIVFNIAVLGALLGLEPLVDPQAVIKVLETKVPAEYLELNRKALDLGLELGRQAKG
jgi:2-oxoglutarate ferredoxin oxidoreductase subunit gamma